MDTLEKKTKVKELWQLCFHDDERFVNLLFDNLYRDENTVCFEKGGEVTTALQMLPYRMSFGETSLDVSYISGAATRPEYRNRGLMGRLLKESFEIMRSRNIPLSALIPAESWLYDYYASKGYASVFFRQELNFTSAHWFYGDGYHRITVSMDELYRFFDEQMRRRSCCIQHGREDFNVICGDIYLDGGDVVALADSANRLSALAFVAPGDDAVFVKELLAINVEAKEAMLHEVQSVFPGYSLRVFTEPTSENGSAVLMGMIRIVDIRRVLESVAKNNRSLRRVFRVHDSLLPVNDGVFLVEEGECYEGVTNPCDFDIDIMELAEIIFGGSKLSSLLDFPSVRPYMSLMLD